MQQEFSSFTGKRLFLQKFFLKFYDYFYIIGRGFCYPQKMRRIFRTIYGRTAAKGRIEYEQCKQTNTGHGKTGTVFGNHRGAVPNAAGIYPFGCNSTDHRTYSRYLRLDFTGMEVRGNLGRTVRSDQLFNQYLYSGAYLFCVYSVLFVRQRKRKYLEFGSLFYSSYSDRCGAVLYLSWNKKAV